MLGIRGESKASLKLLGVLLVVGGLAFVLYARDKERRRAAAVQAGASATLVATPDPRTDAGAAPAAPTPTAMMTDAALATVDAAAAETFDRFAAREAIEAAVAKNDLSALPAIEQTDLTQDGYLAASAIDAVGNLGSIAPEPQKAEAVRTLTRWLEQETRRSAAGAPGAAGNVSILVESLADTKSRDAIAPLVAALDAGTYPLEVQTSIVQSLDALDARTAAGSVERFIARVRALSPRDDLERELSKEALATAQALVDKWHATP